MKRRSTILAALFLGSMILAAPSVSRAFSIRVGGQFIVKDTSHSFFAFSVNYFEAQIVKDYLSFESGTTMSVNGSYVIFNLNVLGLKLTIPALKGRLRPGFRVAFMINDTIRHDPKTANGFGLGALFGPTMAVRLGKTFEIYFDFDIGLYKYLWKQSTLFDLPSQGESLQVLLNMMIGFRF